MLSQIKTQTKEKERKFIFAVITVITMVLPIFMSTYATVSAAVKTESSKKSGNTIEKTYKSKGYDAGVWISSPGRDYREAEVDVPFGKTGKVDVQIRGSWYDHGRGYVETTTHELKSLSASVTNIKGDDFSRGIGSDKDHFFWNENGYKTAQFDVGDICKDKAGTTQEKEVQLQNTFRYKKSGDTNFTVGEASTDTMKVEINCAPDPYWKVVPSTKINKTTAKVGDKITWTHIGKNEGPAKTNAKSEIRGLYPEDTGITRIAWGKTNANDSQSYTTNGLKKGSSESHTFSYTIKPENVGTTICRKTNIGKYAYGKNGWGGRDVGKCVSIPYDYNLTPSVTIPGGNVIEPGTESKITITGNINNGGKTKSRPNGNWQLSRIVFNKTPTPTQKDGGNNSAAACSGKKNCELVKSGTWTSSINPGSNFNSDIKDEYLTEDHPVGTTVCYVLSIKPYSEGSTDWRHSKLQCITYGKKPKVQVWGGDVIAGRSINGSSMGYSGIDTSVSTKNLGGNTYGSWGEYALVANGQVKGMASGAGFNHPDGALSKQQSTWSNITFANTFKPSAPAGMKCTTKQRWGCYAYSIPDMPNLSAKFSVGTSMKAVDTSIGSLVKKTVYVMNGSETINLSGSTLKKGEWVVINAKGATVNITSNINYTNASLANVSEIPQMVIIANNINIAPTVTNVDAWLIASNSLATCNDPGHASNLNTTNTAYNLSSGDCDKPLRVNGPVMTKKLWLRRTAGAGTGNQTGDPAEIFNYRPDAMLWLNNQLNSKALRTTNIRELPPRY